MSKTAEQLGSILREMYNGAERNEQVTMIHLFGIQYHQEIREVGIREVVEASGISSTYKTEVNKGTKLARYVVPIQVRRE